MGKWARKREIDKESHNSPIEPIDSVARVRFDRTLKAGQPRKTSLFTGEICEFVVFLSFVTIPPRDQHPKSERVV